jgi:hypothetical protein
MVKEFEYHQRQTTPEYRENYDTIFKRGGSGVPDSKNAGRSTTYAEDNKPPRLSKTTFQRRKS